jgi:TRAP-type C4-dicarboxylate transport system permease small subunit
MNTKTITKIIVALVLIATVCLAVTTVFGVTIPVASSGGVDGSGGLTGTTARILGVVKYICYAAAVIMLVMLGVKYLTASPDGKAEIKKTAVQYVIGAVLVFAAGVILTIIQNVATATIKDNG